MQQEFKPDENRTPGTPPDPARMAPAFARLCELVAKLRSADGCPWDRQQTLETIKPHTLEETYELLEAIDSGDDRAIVDELGDLLLQVLLDAQIGADEGRFDLVDVVESLIGKLIERHPHVFGNARAESPADVRRHWERIKQKDKPRKFLLDGLPLDLPQLARADRISARAAGVGFDFPQRAMLFDKLREEVDELARELFPDGQIPEVPATVDAQVAPDTQILDPAQQVRVEAEIGDILFVIANIARRWKVNPEEALRQSNRKFATRFRYVELKLAEQGRNLQDATLWEMEDLYQQAKRMEHGREEG